MNKENEKFLAFNEGTIEECEPFKIWWCVFAYPKNEDPTQIVGQSPLIYDSYESYLRYSKERDFIDTMESWHAKGYQVVIRPVKMLNLGN